MAKKSKAMKKRKATKKTASGKRAVRAAALVRIKRAYDPPEKGDGLRILVDRLWPRGVSKAKLKLDDWVKPLAPSTELRKWYQHDPEKSAVFRKRYRPELAAQKAALGALRAAVKGRTVTLVTATRELDLGHAVVLREFLK